MVDEVRDCEGRRYRIGEDPHDILGRPRSSVLSAAGAAMAAVGVMQYGFGAVAPVLAADRGWGLEGVFWLLTTWIVFQAGIGFPVAALRGRRRVAPAALLAVGGVLCAAGLLALALDDGLLGAAGFGVLGGSGAGMVYATCSSVVAAWYPERAGRRVGLVTGAFAYGSLPVVVAAVVGLDAALLTPVLAGAAFVLLVVVVEAGRYLADPPARWWPAHVDPRQWVLRRAPVRMENPAAGRPFTATQALRTRAMLLITLVLTAAVAVSLLNAAFLVIVAQQAGAGTAAVATAAGLLVVLAGAGRSVAVTVADHWGPGRTIGTVLLVQALAQAVLAVAAASHSVGLIVAGAALAGAGGGAFYPLFAGLSREFFGQDNAPEVHAVVYSAKAMGGVLGVGGAAVLATHWGFAATFGLAVVVSGLAALGTRAFARPGLPVTLPVAPRPQVVASPVPSAASPAASR